MAFLLMKNSIQHYAWGSIDAFTRLLGIENEAAVPMAELWMGAHPDGASLVEPAGRQVPLAELIADDPEGMLGERVARAFAAELPFLLKLLAAEKALSIQAHPSQQQAQAGFDRERQCGVPLDGPQRNYKDRNHKPEILCAVEPFWGMCGFRSKADILLEFEEPELQGSGGRKLSAALAAHGKEPEAQVAFLRALLLLPVEQKSEVVDGALALAVRKQAGLPQPDENGTADATVHRYRWVTELGKQFPGDAGILGPLFLQLVYLEPGDALFIGAGTLHAYLHGCGVELMANSNNVLRCGLTPKRIDVPELLRIIDPAEAEGGVGDSPAVRAASAEDKNVPNPMIYRCGNNRPVGKTERMLQPELLPGPDGGIAGMLWRYPVPAAEFSLERIRLQDNLPIERSRAEGPEIVFCLAGGARLAAGGAPVAVSRGQSLFIPARQSGYTVAGEGELFIASVGTVPG